MASIGVIQPLPTDGTLVIPTLDDVDRMIQLYEEMNNGNLTDKKLYRLVSSNIDNLGLLIRMMHLPKLIRLFQTNGLFHPYLTESLVSDLVRKNDKDIYYAILNGSDYKAHVMNVCGNLNHLYNFRDTVIKKRLAEFAKMAKCINLNQFYLGEDLVLYLATIDQESVNVKDLMFTIYPKVNRLELYDPTEVYLDISSSTYYYRLENGIVISFKSMLYQSVGHVLYSGCQAVYDRGRILMRPKLYQQLDSNREFPKFNVNMDGFRRLDERGDNLVLRSMFRIKRKTKQCYDCKKGYNMSFTLSCFPDLCIECGIVNYRKRKSPVDLSGMTAYVSGARHKIGFETVLLLLRYGARVIASTRFPNAAWYNYKGETDFDQWKDRLEIVRCDFTQISEVASLIEHLKGAKLNILINNACQTVKPTDLYLQKALTLETILGGDSKHANKMIENVNMTTTIIKVDENDSLIVPAPKWTDLSVVSAKITDADIRLNQFKDIEDLTMKDGSTWYKTLEEVGLAEIMQVNAVNQVVPTMLVNQLKPYMGNPKFVINVTAVEGQFQTNKANGFHTHTNMCKAGINMMVKTMGFEAEKDFYIYAVDPGYVSGVDPFKDKYPLKPIDGALRIIDPIKRWKQGDPIESGIKLKDYKKSPW